MDDARSIPPLPDELQSLKSLVLTLQRERDELQRERDELQVAKLRIEVELLRLKKLYYGPRADRLHQLGDVNQLLLQFPQDLEARPVNPADLPGDAPETEMKTVRRVRGGRRNLAAFDHLPATRRIPVCLARRCLRVR